MYIKKEEAKVVQNAFRCFYLLYSKNLDIKGYALFRKFFILNIMDRCIIIQNNRTQTLYAPFIYKEFKIMFNIKFRK